MRRSSEMELLAIARIEVIFGGTNHYLGGAPADRVILLLASDASGNLRLS